jgi:hypothetical protein
MPGSAPIPQQARCTLLAVHAGHGHPSAEDQAHLCSPSLRNCHGRRCNSLGRSSLQVAAPAHMHTVSAHDAATPISVQQKVRQQRARNGRREGAANSPKAHHPQLSCYQGVSALGGAAITEQDMRREAGPSLPPQKSLAGKALCGSISWLST